MTPLVGGDSEGQIITSVKKEWVDELSVSDNKDRGFMFRSEIVQITMVILTLYAYNFPSNSIHVLHTTLNHM